MLSSDVVVLVDVDLAVPVLEVVVKSVEVDFSDEVVDAFSVVVDFSFVFVGSSVLVIELPVVVTVVLIVVLFDFVLEGIPLSDVKVGFSVLVVVSL